jgi:hypothetical protein
MLTKTKIKDILHRHLRQFEYDRVALDKKINAKKNFNIGIVLFIVVSVVLVGLVLSVGQGANSYWYIIGSILTAVVLSSIYLYFNRTQFDLEEAQQMKLQQAIKKAVYHRVFKAYNASLEYKPEEAVSEDNFRAAGFYTNFNNYYGEDYGGGELPDGRLFHFSEIRARYQERENGVSQLLFDGLFFIIEDTYPFEDLEAFKERVIVSSIEKGLPKEVYSDTKSKNKAKHTENILDADLALVEKTPPKRRLDKRYAVYAPLLHQVESRLSDEFCKIFNKTNIPLSLSFHDGMVYMLVPFKMDFWEISFKDSFIDGKGIDTLANNFYMTFELLDRLAQATS